MWSVVTPKQVWKFSVASCHVCCPAARLVNELMVNHTLQVDLTILIAWFSVSRASSNSVFTKKNGFYVNF